MGGPMAANLLDVGFEVRAWNRTPGKVDDLVGAGASEHGSPAEAAAGADVLLTMLSDGDAVLEVAGAIEGSQRGGEIWLQMSTIGAEASDDCARLAERLGLTYVDAPVLGTKQPAEAGELVVLAAGPDDTLDSLEPLFEAIGKRTLRVGEAGAASRLKVAVNAWIAAVVEGAAETLALAEGTGVDPRTVLEALSGGPLDLPYLRIKAEAMIEREFPPSFRLALAAKDAGLAASAARSHGLDLPMIDVVAERLRGAAAEHGEEDIAATFLASAPALSR